VTGVLRVTGRGWLPSSFASSSSLLESGSMFFPRVGLYFFMLQNYFLSLLRHGLVA
jgi:hypothetical protein